MLIVIKNNTRCFKSEFAVVFGLLVLVLYILADLISSLEIQRLQLAGSSSTVFAVNLILYTRWTFWSGIWYGFRGNYGVYERIYGFNSKWVWKKVKYANSKWVWKARSENGYGFQRSGLKVGVENDICLAWNRVRILTTRWHAPTKNSHEYPPPPRGQRAANCRSV